MSATTEKCARVRCCSTKALLRAYEPIIWLECEDRRWRWQGGDLLSMGSC